jgi:hypothetical protein
LPQIISGGGSAPVVTNVGPKKKKKDLGISGQVGAGASTRPVQTPQPSPAPPPVTLDHSADVSLESKVQNLSLAYKDIAGVFPAPDKALDLTNSLSIIPGSHSIPFYHQLLEPALSAPWAQPQTLGQSDWLPFELDKQASTMQSIGQHLTPFVHDWTKGMSDNMLSNDMLASAVKHLDAGLHLTGPDAITEQNSALSLKELLTQRNDEMGISSTFEMSPVVDADTKRQYISMVIGRNLVYLSPDTKVSDEQRQKARDAISTVTGGQVSNNSIDTLLSTLQTGGGKGNDNLSNYFYTGFIYGRPVGESVEGAKEDLYDIAPNYLPPAEQTKIANRRNVVYTYLFQKPAEAINAAWTGSRQATEEMNTQMNAEVHKKILGPAHQMLNDIAPGLGDDLASSLETDAHAVKTISAHVGTMTSTVGDFVGGTAKSVSSAYEKYSDKADQLILTPLAVIAYAINKRDPGALISPHEWSQAFKSEAHKNVVGEFFKFFEDHGVIDKNDPFVKSSYAIGDFIWSGVRDLYVGKAIGVGSKALAGELFKGGRAVAGVAESAGNPMAEIGQAVSEVTNPRVVSGARVADVGGATVDAGIAPTIAKLNDAGYQTFGSHSGFAADHVASHPARGIPGYVEFENGVDAKAIKEAADQAGLSVTSSPEKRLIVTAPAEATRVAKARWAKFSDALAPAAEPVAQSAPPRLIDVVFANNAEAISRINGPGAAFTIRKMFGIPDAGPEVKAIVQRLAEATDTQSITEEMFRLEKQHGVQVNPFGYGVVKEYRMNHLIQGKIAEQPDIVRSLFDVMAIDRRIGLEKNADNIIYNLGKSLKMGSPDWTKAHAARVVQYADDMYKAETNTQRANILDKFWDEVHTNLDAPVKRSQVAWMRKMGVSKETIDGIKTWEQYANTWEAAARGENRVFNPRRRFYHASATGTEISRVVPANLPARLHGIANEADAQLQEMLTAAGASKADLAKARAASERAHVELDRYAGAVRTLENPKSSAAAIDEARSTVDSYATTQPWMTGQLMQGYMHKRSPVYLAKFMAGQAARRTELLNSWKFIGGRMSIDDVTNMYKQLVMVNMGFPVKVLLGDEALRTIPEGSILHARAALKRTAKLKDANMLPEGLHEPVAQAWFGKGYSDDWVSIPATEPEHFSALAAEVGMAKQEPFIQIWREAGGNTERALPLWRKAINEKTERGALLRQFLAETERQPGTYVTKNTQRWLAQWAEYTKRFENDPRLFRALMGKDEAGNPVNLTQAEYNNIPKEHLWPSNYMNQVWSSTSKGLPGINWLGDKVVFKLLGTMTNKLNDMQFGFAYNKEAASILKRDPKIDPAELHAEASEKAMAWMKSVTYQPEATVFEAVNRNMALFLTAYRQFAAYWGKLFAKRPIMMTGVAKSLNDQNGGNPLAAQFMTLPGLSDYTFYNIFRPFWAGQSMASSFTPNLGPFPIVLLRGVNWLGDLGGRWKGSPVLSFADPNVSMLSWVDDLMYGIWGKSLPVLSKDKAARDRTALNIALAQIKIGQQPNADAAIAEMMQKPGWFKFMEGVGFQHPEAVFGALTKLGSPIGKITYQPKSDKAFVDALWNWRSAKDDAAKQKVRDGNPQLNQWIAYYESTPQDRERILTTPGNEWLMKYTISDNMQDALFSDTSGYWWGQKGPATMQDFLAKQQTRYDSVFGKYGDVNRPRAESLLNSQLKASDAWAKKTLTATINTLSKNKTIRANLFDFYWKRWDQWKRGYVKTIDEGGDRKVTNPPPPFSNVPDEYNAVQLYADWKAQWGKSPKLDSMARGPSAHTIEISDILSNYLPADVARSLWEGPYAQGVANIRQDRQEHVRKTLLGYATNPGYRVNSQMLQSVGVKASGKTDLALMKVEAMYQEWHLFKAGTKEYKAARQDFYAKRAQILSGVPGGRELLAGVPGMIPRLKYFTEPRGQAAAESFGRNKGDLHVLYTLATKQYPTKAASDAAGQKIYSIMQTLPPSDRKYFDGYIASHWWHAMLTYAQQYRTDLKTSYSDYYKGPGNSLASKYGMAKVKEFSSWIDSMTKRNKTLAEDVKTYFGDSKKLSRSLLNWY